MSEQTGAEMKRMQLEREIHQSSASEAEKVNMIHSLSKLWMYLCDERDTWKKRAGQHGCNTDEGDHECG